MPRKFSVKRRINSGKRGVAKVKRKTKRKTRMTATKRKRRR